MYNDEIVINGNKLTRKYIENLNKEQRVELIEPIFQYFRKQGFMYPDNEGKLWEEYNRLKNVKLDLESKELYNNSSLGTFICKYFCKSFYSATEPGKKNMLELFKDDEILKKVIENRLGITWYQQHGETDIEAFPISFRQIIQGLRSMRLVPMVSMFKPEIAKFIYEKYSKKNDIVYDYSAGFGGRMMAATICDRQYVGVDPLTIPDLEKMGEYFNIKNCLLIKGMSEEICLEKNSIDLAFSSPPYNNQEFYSKDETQAYNKGENYFYNVYWRKTLENIYYMLKPGKNFILNVKNFPKMLEMAKEKFELVDEIYMRTVKSHLNKKGKEDAQKMESIYIFIK